jgi:seryl-tRNA synthetase
MTEINKKQGFHEDVDPLLGKARKHSIVAQKTKFDKEQVSKTSAIVPVPVEEDKVTLRYEYSQEFKELAGQFEEDNDVLLEINKDGDDIIVEIPVENSADFIEFLAENDIKVKEEAEEAVDNATENVNDTDNKDDDVDSSAELKCKIDEIIADVQSKRSKRALASDKLRTAKKVGDKGNAFDLISWLKNPGKSDLVGVDTHDAE